MSTLLLPLLLLILVADSFCPVPHHQFKGQKQQQHQEDHQPLDV